MWYGLWTKAGNEKNTKSMIENHVDHFLFTRCIVTYRRKREFYGSDNIIVEKLLFPSNIFVETNHIEDFAKCLQWYPGKNTIMRFHNTNLVV